MAFINTSTITNGVAKSGAAAISALQTTPISATIGKIPSTVASTVLGGVTNPLSGFVGGGVTGGAAAISSTVGKISGVAGGLTSTVGSLTSLASNPLGAVTNLASNYLGSALKSITSTFEGAITGLASGINPNFATIFNDTSVTTAANRVANISDPVKNLLNAKKPESSPFKVTSLVGASETVTMSGSSSEFGSKSGDMIGGTLNTVLNRFNLDSVSSLGGALTNSQSSLLTGGLFSNVGSLVKSVTALPNQLISGVTQALGNDVQSFLGRASSVIQSSGLAAPLNFFTQVAGVSLFDQTGASVNTNGVAVDAATGNGLLNLVRLIGCDDSLNGVEYTSANETMSLFNLSLGLASEYGMSDLVDSLLGCSLATSTSGQTALSSAFTNTVGSNIDLATSLVDKIDNKSALNTDLITASLVTNPNLTAASKSQVDYVAEALGTTTEKAYTVKEVSLSSMFVYDYKKIAGSNSNFTDAVFIGSALTNYVKGKPVAVKADGTIGV